MMRQTIRDKLSLQSSESMDAEESKEDAQVGSIEVATSILPELEAYLTLLVLMLEADKSQFTEVCNLLQSLNPGSFAFCVVII